MPIGATAPCLLYKPRERRALKGHAQLHFGRGALRGRVDAVAWGMRAGRGAICGHRGCGLCVSVKCGGTGRFGSEGGNVGADSVFGGAVCVGGGAGAV